MVGDDLKHDVGKPRFELIDTGAERLLAMVLTAGAIEYKDHGWWRLNTVDGRDRVIGSLRRHLNAYQEQHADGAAIDAQFGLPHSGHLLACAMFLASFDVANMELYGDYPKVEEAWHKACQARTRKEPISVAAQKV